MWRLVIAPPGPGIAGCLDDACVPGDYVVPAPGACVLFQVHLTGQWRPQSSDQFAAGEVCRIVGRCWRRAGAGGQEAQLTRPCRVWLRGRSECLAVARSRGRTRQVGVGADEAAVVHTRDAGQDAPRTGAASSRSGLRKTRARQTPVRRSALTDTPAESTGLAPPDSRSTR